MTGKHESYSPLYLRVLRLIRCCFELGHEVDGCFVVCSPFFVKTKHILIRCPARNTRCHGCVCLISLFVACSWSTYSLFCTFLKPCTSWNRNRSMALKESQELKKSICTGDIIPIASSKMKGARNMVFSKWLGSTRCIATTASYVATFVLNILFIILFSSVPSWRNHWSLRVSVTLAAMAHMRLFFSFNRSRTSITRLLCFCISSLTWFSVSVRRVLTFLSLIVIALLDIASRLSMAAKKTFLVLTYTLRLPTACWLTGLGTKLFSKPSVVGFSGLWIFFSLSEARGHVSKGIP